VPEQLPCERRTATPCYALIPPTGPSSPNSNCCAAFLDLDILAVPLNDYLLSSRFRFRRQVFFSLVVACVKTLFSPSWQGRIRPIPCKGGGEWVPPFPPRVETDSSPVDEGPRGPLGPETVRGLPSLLRTVARGMGEPAPLLAVDELECQIALLRKARSPPFRVGDTPAVV